jgi:proteasome lid subunit RPN8/RPN11
LTVEALETLREEAERARPAECCGVLAGRDGRVALVIPVPNTADDAHVSYEMDPSELWAARRRAVEAGLDVVGFYHSHPTTSPAPSEHDLRRAYYPEAAYAIVGPSPDYEVRAYRIVNGRASAFVVELDDSHAGAASQSAPTT